jgi:hypothetical protein
MYARFLERWAEKVLSDALAVLIVGPRIESYGYLKS